MDSISKVSVSHKTIKAIIRKAFGSKTGILGIEENTQGWFNALYDVQLDTGHSVFLKMAPPDETPILRYEKDLLKTEMEVLKLFNETSKVPVPKLLFSDCSRKLVDTDFFIMEKLKGSSLGQLQESLDDASLKKIDFDKGEINHQINKITGSEFGLYGSAHKKFPTWYEAFTNMVEYILLDAEDFGVSLLESPEKIMDIFCRNKAALDLVTKPSLCHWDLHDGNIIIDSHGKISGLIDCDRALWGDPIIEFYFSEMFPSKSDFYMGYGKNEQKSQDEVLRRSLYDLYLTLIFVTECRSRNIQDPNHLTWAENCLKKELEKQKELYI